MPKKKAKESVAELKEQLEILQEKVAEYEPATSYEVKDLYTWSSPQRLFIPRDKKWYTYVILLVLIITLGLLFLRQFIIIAPVLAIAFVAYVLASVPAENVEHKITTQGINTSAHSYLWSEMIDFWFTNKSKETILYIDTYLNFPRRLIILVGQGDMETIKKKMVQYIPYRELPKTSWMDRVADFFTNKFQKIAN